MLSAGSQAQGGGIGHRVPEAGCRDGLWAGVWSETTGQRIETRSRVVLRPADGLANERIVVELGDEKMTVLVWRGRFRRDCLAGLANARRPGWAPACDRAHGERVITLGPFEPPAATARWSTLSPARSG